MSFLKKLASDTAIYGVSSLLGRFLNYVLVPFHTGIFKPEEYGIVSVFYAYAVLLNVVYTYGFETAFFRFATLAKQNNTNDTAGKTASPEQVFNLALTSLLLSSLIFSSLLFFFAPEIATFLGYPSAQNYLYWFALILAIDAVVAIPFARLRLENKAKKFAFIKSFNIVLNVFFNYFFLYFLKNAAEGTAFEGLKPLADWLYDPNLGLGYVFLANLIANFCFLPLLYAEWRRFRWVWLPNLWKKMWLYGYPILLIGLAYSVMSVADRTFLEWWLPPNFYQGRSSLDAVGIYSACYKFSIFINLAVQAFKYAAEPFFFAKAADKDSPQTFATISTYFLWACLAMFVAVSLNIGWLAQWLISRPDYREGLEIVPILLLSNTFLGLYYNISVAFKVSDRTYLGIYTTLIGALVSIGVNYALIPHLGYMGSAWATLGSYALMLLTAYFLGQRYFPIPYPWGRMLVLIGVACSIILYFHFLQREIYTSIQFVDYILPNFVLLIFVIVSYLFVKKS
ncbi:polysaccharide biosynthesis C-terminal domain-containing protein [Hugenholtzia roseola]|uniref:oligosaccharide flippase family protein n=1 Tax=Hugenholtzia roseola TaxID=1002 RepID=UPI000410A92B|nr:polysaccharide biosynthesis C-terminal domain-containing protein [Hugenholtzia roseola]